MAKRKRSSTTDQSLSTQASVTPGRKSPGRVRQPCDRTVRCPRLQALTRSEGSEVEKLSAETGKKTQAGTARAPKQKDKAPPRDLHFPTCPMLKNHHHSFLSPSRSEE